MDIAVLLNQKRTNVCDNATRMASLQFFKGATRGLQEEWMEENLIEFVCKFKMAVGNMVSIRGQVMEYMYIPTGIKRELVRSGVDSD